jgi:hypothetical protein
VRWLALRPTFQAGKCELLRLCSKLAEQRVIEGAWHFPVRLARFLLNLVRALRESIRMERQRQTNGVSAKFTVAAVLRFTKALSKLHWGVAR